MKKCLMLTIALGLLGTAHTAENSGKIITQRAPAEYLTTNPLEVDDTCPQNDIYAPFTCTKEQAPGFSCYDVSAVQGDPIPAQRYELLEESLSPENVSADPQCLQAEPTCAAFLKQLDFNLDFTWFIANFPSSSFPECGKTYTCTRIVCYMPPKEGQTPAVSQKLSCVYKKHQRFFVGSRITCARQNAK